MGFASSGQLLLDLIQLPFYLAPCLSMAPGLNHDSPLSLPYPNSKVPPHPPWQLPKGPGTGQGRAGTCFPHGKEALDVTTAAPNLGTIAPSPVGRQDASVIPDDAAGP